MKSYGVGIINDLQMGPAIVQYLERIDATLAPYEGRLTDNSSSTVFLIDGVDPDHVATDVLRTK